MRKSTAACKQQGETLTSSPKVVLKAAIKRKIDAKDDCPSKKGTGPSMGDQQQKSPPPLRREVDKGLMMSKGPVVTNPFQRLVTHKDYALEMVNLITKKMDSDPCDKHTTEDLEASGLYDLSRVRVCCFQLNNSCVLILTLIFFFLFSFFFFFFFFRHRCR